LSNLDDSTPLTTIAPARRVRGDSTAPQLGHRINGKDAIGVDYRHRHRSAYLRSLHIKHPPPGFACTSMPAHRIGFDETDGHPSRWPRCGRLPDGGALDRLFSNDEHMVKFLDKLAAQLAKLLNYPGVHYYILRSTGHTDIWQAGDVKARIDSLPRGYGLFVRSAKNGRRDRYLRGEADGLLAFQCLPNQPLGSRHVNRFRSPAEFAPHALWLLTDASLDPSNCRCKYCLRNGDRTPKTHKARLSGSSRRQSRRLVGRLEDRCDQALQIPVEESRKAHASRIREVRG